MRYRKLRYKVRVPFASDVERCSARREGDEIACRCGKRWAVGEDHP